MFQDWRESNKTEGVHGSIDADENDHLETTDKIGQMIAFTVSEDLPILNWTGYSSQPMYNLNHNKLSKNMRFTWEVVNQHAQMLNKIKDTD